MQDTVIVVEPSGWSIYYSMLARRLPEAKQVKFQRFQNGASAARHALESTDRILGYICDLTRQTQDPAATIDFYNSTVARLAPNARALLILDGVSSLPPPSYSRHLRIINRHAEKEIVEDHLRWLIDRNRAVDDAAIDRESTLLQVSDIPWREITRYISENPAHLHGMDPWDFEQLIAELFRDSGWIVDVTAKTRDGGHDIIAIRKVLPTQFKLLIEAKRFDPNRKVGVGIVRSLWGIRQNWSASQVVLATTSYVSEVAKKEFSRVVPWELDFLERDKILDWCRLYAGVELGGTFDKRDVGAAIDRRREGPTPNPGHQADG